jgi:hypothetical protein
MSDDEGGEGYVVGEGDIEEQLQQENSKAIEIANQLIVNVNMMIDTFNIDNDDNKIEIIYINPEEVINNIYSRLKLDSYFRRDNEGKIMDNQYVMEIQLGENVNKENVYEYISGIMNIKNR